MSFESRFLRDNASDPARFDLASVAVPSKHERRRLQVLCFILSAPLLALGTLAGYAVLTSALSVAARVGLLTLTMSCFVTVALLVSLARRFTGPVPTRLSLDSTGFVLTYGDGKSRALRWNATTSVAEMTDARLMPGIRWYNTFSIRPRRSPEIAITREAYEAVLSAARSNAAILSERSIRIWSGRLVRTVLGGEEHPVSSPLPPIIKT